MSSHLVDSIILGTGTDAFVLVTPGLDAVEAFELPSTREGEDFRFVRAQAGASADRGNVAATLDLKITRIHDTPIAARQYVLERAKAFGAYAPPASAQRTLYLTYTGGGTLAYTMPNATIRLYAGQAIGATTIHTARISGGPIQ